MEAVKGRDQRAPPAPRPPPFPPPDATRTPSASLRVAGEGAMVTGQTPRYSAEALTRTGETPRFSAETLTRTGQTPLHSAETLTHTGQTPRYSAETLTRTPTRRDADAVRVAPGTETRASTPKSRIPLLLPHLDKAPTAAS
jgi:hypothetical protein